MPDHSTKNAAISALPAPHCLLDFPSSPYGRRPETPQTLVALVKELARGLDMKLLGRPMVVEDGPDLSVYQIISTSHIILHMGPSGIHADLFSCEPFDMDRCVDMLLSRFGPSASIQYCQRNLFTSPGRINPLPMANMNALTRNPNTFTHALINWYRGKEKMLADADYGRGVLRRAVDCLSELESLPPASVELLDVPPIPTSWDRGGFSGGYVNVLRQLTMHTFRGLNGAYMDIMAHVFDLEKILRIIQEGFGFRFFEVDAIFQRSVHTGEAPRPPKGGP